MQRKRWGEGERKGGKEGEGHFGTLISNGMFPSNLTHQSSMNLTEERPERMAQRVTPKYFLLFEKFRAQWRKIDYRSEARDVQSGHGKSCSRRLQGSKIARTVSKELRSLLGAFPTDQR